MNADATADVDHRERETTMRSTLKLGIAVAILASTALLYRRFTTTESIPEATTTDATTADAPATATTDATGE